MNHKEVIMRPTATFIAGLGLVVIIALDGVYGFPASFALGQDPVQLGMLALSMLIDALGEAIRAYRLQTA